MEEQKFYLYCANCCKAFRNQNFHRLNLTKDTSVEFDVDNKRSKGEANSGGENTLDDENNSDDRIDPNLRCKPAKLNQLNCGDGDIKHHQNDSEKDNIEDGGVSNNCKHAPDDDSVEIAGISLFTQFIDEESERKLVDVIDDTTWVESQSGRKKQDYGPKVNFKKKKIKVAGFSGLPLYSFDIVKKIKQCTNDFRPVEMCCLDYRSNWGSSIDPHYDDTWIWGERLVTLNLINTTYHSLIQDSHPNIEVLVKLEARCLVVCQGEARYKWRHGIRGEHVANRRLAITFRTTEYLPGRRFTLEFG